MSWLQGERQACGPVTAQFETPEARRSQILFDAEGWLTDTESGRQGEDWFSEQANPPVLPA